MMRAKETAKKKEVLAADSSRFTEEHIVQKLALLRTPSAKEALKEAERALNVVISAITHTLAEGDVTVSNLGTFRASMQGANRIRISFSPAEKLKKAVEARLSMKKAGAVNTPKR
jgi:nucleoid DNA-binding protein